MKTIQTSEARCRDCYKCIRHCPVKAIGLKNGWASDEYAIALAFALIVMYDASGVRRAVGKQAIILNQLIKDWQKHKLKEKQLKELIGHTPIEVIAGGLIGILIACIFI